MSGKAARQPTRQNKQGQGQRQSSKKATNVAIVPPQAMPAAAKAEIQATQEAKREARMQRQEEARAAAERRRRQATIRKYGIIVAVALVIVAGIGALILNEANKPGQGVATQPSPHIASVNDAHVYNSDPPTSGPHLSALGPWGVSTVPITKEMQVHNLEDGGVIINYKPDLDKVTFEKLATITRSYDSFVQMAPYTGLTQSIVLTTWGRMDRLDAFDEARIQRFVEAYRGKDHHKDSGS